MKSLYPGNVTLKSSKLMHSLLTGLITFFYAFPPFSLILKCLHKIKTDRATGILVFPYWPSQPWFPLLDSLLAKKLLIFEPNSSMKQNSSLKSWWIFCKKYNIDTYEASISYILKFLSESFESGAAYGTINTTRSAFLPLISSKIGSDDRIKRFMRGVYCTKPPAPKYNLTRDPGVVLTYLANFYLNIYIEDISLEKLTKKVVTILALTTGHRVQTLSLINIKNIKVMNDGIQIYIPDIIKTSKTGSLQPLLHLKTFENRIEICPVTAVKCYINRTKPLRRGTDKLLLTWKKPHNCASTQTISRWIKTTLHESGIDVNTFTAHSTRHARTSAAKRSGISIDQIQRTAGWSQNSATFARHYNRPVIQEPTVFSDVICNTINNIT